jgi:hypothetical protein
MRGLLLAPILMIAFATASSVALLRDASLRYVHRTPQVVGALDVDLASLRQIVPRGETLGFITDRNDVEAVDERLYGLSYSLAPLIVENTANRRFVIGDFRRKANIPIALTQYRLRVVETLGNGFLFCAPQ